MNMNTYMRGMMFVAAGLLMQGCLSGHGGKNASGSKEAALEMAVDDQVMKMQLLSESKKRLDAKALTSGETLRKGLSRTSTRVRFSAPSQHTLSDRELYLHGRESIVILGTPFLCGKCKNLHLSTGAGFAVAEDGVFLTNYHVVGSVSNGLGMVAITADGKLGGVTEVLAANQVEDWALLRVPELNLKPLPLRGNVPVGSEVVLVSHPNEHFFSFGKGNVARYGKGRPQMSQDAAKNLKNQPVSWWLEITAEFGRGASGGPVMDRCGNVVGLISRVEGTKVGGTDEDHGLGRMVFKQCTPIGFVIKGGTATP